MIDGTYQFLLDTPMGKEKGTLVLTSNQNLLSGTIKLAGYEKRIQGKVSGNHFEFSSSFQKLVFHIQFHVSGAIQNNKLSALVKSNYGNMNIIGTKV